MTFRYFAYGSNMLTQRIRINSPSANVKSIAELKKYKLIFTDYSKSWQGCAATIVESKDDSVWGVVWEISKEHEESLNEQEDGYKVSDVKVFSPTLGEIECRVYQKSNVDNEGLPSFIYKTAMIQGATEHEIPAAYILKLEKLPDNGYQGPVAIPINIVL